MKKAKLRRFAEWLREQPNSIPGVCGIRGEPLFSWFSSYKCVAAYAQAWEDGTTIPAEIHARSDVFVRVFSMPRKLAGPLYTAGTRALTAKGDQKVRNAPLAKVADVIDLLAEGWGVDAAMEATFGKRSFLHSATVISALD